MTKITDLELIKAIVKIEGFDYTIRRDSVCPSDPTDVIKHKLTDVYNPLTDDALCFELMKKHDINNSRAGIRTDSGEAVYCAKKHDSNAELVFSRSRNKVILLAILAANRSLTA